MALNFSNVLLVKGESGYNHYFRRLGGLWSSEFNGWLFDELCKPSLDLLQGRIARGEAELLADAVEDNTLSAIKKSNELMLQRLEEMKREDAAGYLPCSAKRNSGKHWRETVNKEGNRTGVRWTADEEEALLVAVKEGQSHSQIATAHDRKAGAIQSRLAHIALELLKQDKTEDEVLQATQLTGEQLRLIKLYGTHARLN